MLKNISLFSILLLLSGCDNLSPKKAFFWSDAESLIQEIEGENIRQHMRVLADDEMQGREAGTDNYDKAANYVIQKYEEYGLKPLSANDNNYLQPIKFLESRLDLDSPNLSISNGRDTLDFDFKEEFIRSSGYGNNSEQVTASLVFVGYGINAPEYDHNDYSEIEVKDKILVV